MKQNINNVNLDFICNQKWDAMEDTSEGKFCNGCQKTVYDLTDKNANYFLKLLTENGQGFCGRYKTHQLIQNPVEDKSWKKWAIAAMIFIGFGSFMPKAAAQGVKEPRPQPLPADASCQQNMILGKIAMPELDTQTKANLNAMHSYLKNAYRGPAALNATFMISFHVGKDGTPCNMQSNLHPEGEGQHIVSELKLLLSKAPTWKRTKVTAVDINRRYSLFLEIHNGKIIGAERL